MSYSQLTIQDGYPADANAAKITQTKIVSSYQDILFKYLPDHLLTFADKDSWSFISLDEIIYNKTQNNLQNIYIDQNLLKSHDPNLIFEKIRKNLSDNNYLAFRIVTAENIKFSIKRKFSPIVFPIYYPFHFLSRRVLPKLKGFRKICRLLAIPVDISKAEIMGRLIYKGFEIIDLIETDSETLIVTKADSANNPSSSKPVPNEGFLFKMKRIGINGKEITVYKFRSMHPYAEYVQDYLHKTNGLDVSGKFKNDFRVSTGGRVIRKYWIDELPMLYNLLRGDLKLVGVRPISEHYFNLYPAYAQVLRRMHKPGLLPPFYADMPKTFDEIIQSEMAYLTKYEKAPLQTDLTYLIRILKNIVLHQARSK